MKLGSLNFAMREQLFSFSIIIFNLFPTPNRVNSIYLTMLSSHVEQMTYLKNKFIYNTIY